MSGSLLEQIKEQLDESTVSDSQVRNYMMRSLLASTLVDNADQIVEALEAARKLSKNPLNFAAKADLDAKLAPLVDGGSDG